jgi:predicted metal-dependent phosphoesterase TrpH
LIDLHLHTTASDGRLTPAVLVERVHAAGITVMSVTDHDTVAALSEVRRAAAPLGITLVDGIEVTAVHDGRDVHMLGYFIDSDDAGLASFLQEQRRRRVERAREIGARLARLGVPVNVEALIARAARRPGTSVGRANLARALVRAGYVATVHEAFDRFLGSGQAAFVPRTGKGPAAVIDVIHRAGGLASMAHPGVTRQPAVMAGLVGVGLDAVEVYHSDHTPQTVRELLRFATECGLLVSGGSDFHGDDDSRDRRLGRTTLPVMEFERLSTARRAV